MFFFVLLLEKNKKISPRGLEGLNEILKRIYRLYYAFNLEELEAFGTAIEQIKKDTQEPKELYLLYTQIFDIHGLALTKNIGGKMKQKLFKFSSHKRSRGVVCFLL